MITYNVDGVKMPKIKKRDTSAWIRKVAASHGRKVGEIGYMFVDDEKILEVNNEYLGHDYYPQGDIVIETDRTSPSQLYINSMTLGGKKLNSYRISHKQLVEGKTLKMTLKK